MKAIILSAGQGKRLLPLTAERPKCLLPLDGMTLLERQLEGLAAAGISEAVVVTGFGAQAISDLVEGRSFGGMSVRTLYNPFYSVADNLASCWIARGEMAGAFMILNGDTLFDEDVGSHVLRHEAQFPITVTINRKPSYDADDMKVSTEGERLLAIGKDLQAPDVDGESIGFLRFSADGAEIFVREIERAMSTREGLRQWYLSVIDRIAKTQGNVGVVSIQGLDWCELDFPQDYEAMQAMVRGWTRDDAAFPALQAQAAS